MERLSHVYDGTSMLIFLLQYALDDKKNVIKLSNEQYAKAAKTISSPAIIIDLNDCQTRYYYRAICWDKTVLIGVSFIHGIWQVKEYLENPSGSFVLSLLKGYLQEGSIMVYLQNEIADNNLEDL